MPQFGGAAEKCSVCSKTVYLAEKIVVEDKEDKKTFHKTCLRCSHCKVILTLGNYASMQGIFYCKPHFKQLFATKGNYDEGFGKDKHTKNWTPQAVASPASFVPLDKDEQSASSGKKETPSTIASKFGRTTLNTEKCHVCNKTVYATEKTVIEEKEGKKVFHKTCLKCSHCNVIVTLGNYASMQGVVYCKPHFKQLFAAKGNYDEGFGKEKASSKWEPQTSTAPSTFVPVDKDDGPKEKRNAPDNVASRFKGASNTEKCSACAKTVYLTERIVVEDKEDKQTFHKSCLRCTHCQAGLTLGNYASMQGVMYCKPHFKQLFAAKGNYDEGFGKEKHSKKWSEKDGEGGEQEEDTREQDLARERELEQEIEREKAAQERKEREREKEEQERERKEREREDREERERLEVEKARKEVREREEREEREREEREEREREKQEAAERKRLEEEQEREQEVHHHDHDHDHEHDHEHHHDHDHEHDQDHDHEHHHHDEEDAVESSEPTETSEREPEDAEPSQEEEEEKSDE